MACASPARRLGYKHKSVANGILSQPLCLNTPLSLLSGSNGNTGVGHNHWFLFVVVTSFIFTLLWSFFYFLQMKDSIKMNLPFRWLKLEYFYTVAVTVLYFISFIVILAGFGYCAGSSWCDGRIAAGVFAIFNTIAYALGAYILHNDYKATPPELQ